MWVVFIADGRHSKRTSRTLDENVPGHRVFPEVTDVQAVILAAGRGSRLEPVTYHIPKPLIPFWGRPFLSYLLENLEGLVDEVLIVEDPDREVSEALGGSHGSTPLRYVVQPEPLGTGDAVLQAADMLEETFILMLGDTCAPPETIRELIDSPGDAVLTTTRVDDPENHLSVAMDEQGRVAELWTDDETVDAGMFRIPSRICELLESVEPRRGEVRITQGIDRMIQQGEDVRAVVMPGPWVQFGDHERLNGVLRVMTEIRNDESYCDGSSVDADTCEACEIRNSLVFGPGELINCVVTDSMVYCGTRVENARIEGEIIAFSPDGVHIAD
jgi:dTDP-glucose pyrophosphorylase